MTWKSGTFLVLTAGLSIIGIKELVTEKEQVSTNEEFVESIDSQDNLLNSYPETENLGLGIGTETGSTWEPSPVGLGDENYNSGVNEEQKIKNRAEAAKIYPVLNDYSFKMFGPCANGTGWILDYEIPEGNKYPTKWYIATASHVIWRYRFSEEGNTYKQLIPYSNTDALRRKHKENYDKHLDKDRLVKDGESCDAGDAYGYFDINIAQQETGQKLGANKGAIAKGQMKEPKLFYAAFNFLENKVKEKYNLSNHFADFAVLEIEFTSPEIAEKATNNFANKYKDNKHHPLNVLADPLEKKHDTWFKLQNSLDNYYILGYPVEGKGEFEQTKNWDEKSTIASHLNGFARAKNISVWNKGRRKFKWLGEEYQEFGHFYSFGRNPLGGGASGGLFVDGQGNALGVLVQGSYSNSLAQPLRSLGTKEDQHGAETPAYDLIAGVSGQRNSYKQQVQEYILKQGRKTWLSTIAGWEKDK